MEYTDQFRSIEGRKHVRASDVSKKRSEFDWEECWEWGSEKEKWTDSWRGEERRGEVRTGEKRRRGEGGGEVRTGQERRGEGRKEEERRGDERRGEKGRREGRLD